MTKKNMMIAAVALIVVVGAAVAVLVEKTGNKVSAPAVQQPATVEQVEKTVPSIEFMKEFAKTVARDVEICLAMQRELATREAEEQAAREAEARRQKEIELAKLREAARRTEQKKVEEAQPAIQPASAQSEYTGLVVDARGIGFKASMSPRILVADGSEIWGTMNIDPDFVISKGIASFHKNLDNAMKDERAGSKPLVIKAEAVTGNTKSDAVVSIDVAQTIRKANGESGFFDRLAVVFVM